MIDPASRQKIADIPLKGHPQSFQFDETGSRISSMSRTSAGRGP